MPTPSASRVPVATLLLAAAVMLGGGAIGYLTLEQGRRLDANTAVLEQILGEVTRLRVEQSASTKGPKGLLEKLRTYAPLLASSRTTDPDYQNAAKEMNAIMVAFASLGKDAWQPVQARLAELKPGSDFDEIKHLLRASVEIDQAEGTKLLQEVLLGQRLPAPRVRWYAAQELTRVDLPSAQKLLRRVLLTESSRGVNPDRAQAYGGGVPDVAALATTGFHNFVIHYVATKDPELEDTLLQVIGRVEHDVITIQECVKALGENRCARAVPTIEKLFLNPPLKQENPIFLNHCIRALIDIQGREARPFLEQALLKSNVDTVAKFIRDQLAKLPK